MIPRLDIQFPLKRQWQYWFGRQYEPREGEYLLNHARTGIVMVLRAALQKGGRVGVAAYNCHTVANAVVNAGCTPVFVDVTEELKIDVEAVPMDLDAIVVTNLFGIRNDVDTIRKRCPHAVIIVDNAHGYGLPAEGDFTVYSINQGKFPSIGEGGILKVAPSILDLRLRISDLYSHLPQYNMLGQVKLFCSMLVKAIAYSPFFYWQTMKMKKSANPDVHEKVTMGKMAPGVRRLYQAWLPTAETEIAKQKRNAEAITNLQFPISNIKYLIGDNAFMLIARSANPKELKEWFAIRGVETATHFARAIDWATEFGYKRGVCPRAEKLSKQLLMIQTYKRI